MLVTYAEDCFFTPLETCFFLWLQVKRLQDSRVSGSCKGERMMQVCEDDVDDASV